MASSLPSSLQFLFLGNHPVLDFVNTVKREEGGLVDLLCDPSTLGDWATRAGLGFPRFEADEQDLAEAKRLRQALRELLLAWHREEPPDMESLERLNRVLRWRREAPTLDVQDGRIRWRRKDASGSPRDLLLFLAEQAAELLTRGDRRRLKPCGGQECVLLFWDTSRNLSRRWCSMATCGNRSKVSRHYHRHRGS